MSALPYKRIGSTAPGERPPSACADLRGVGNQSLELARLTWKRWIMANGPWDWFLTLTFTEDWYMGIIGHEESALAIFRQFLGRVKQAHKQARANAGLRRNPRFRWVTAMEPHADGRIHLHSLIAAAGLSDMSRFRAESRWEACGGGMARILPAVNKAAPYLSKYIAKGGFLLSGASGEGRDTHRRGHHAKTGTKPPRSQRFPKCCERAATTAHV